MNELRPNFSRNSSDNKNIAARKNKPKKPNTISNSDHSAI